MFCVFSGYLNANEMNVSLNKNQENIVASQVVKCTFDGLKNTDFCDDEKLKIYQNKINKGLNFDKDKVLIVINKNTTLYNGVPRSLNFIIVYDPEGERIYPFYQVVGNFVNNRLEEDLSDPALIKYSKDSNKVCLSGTLFYEGDNDINVEDQCYIFSKKQPDFFKKI